MEKKLLILFLSFYIQLCGFCNEQIKAYFNSDCEKAVVAEITKAKKNITIAIYSFTRLSIAEELSKASSNGVDVRILWDTTQLEGNEYALKSKEIMEKAKVKIFMVKKESKMHHKFMVIDNETVLTGSFNFTTAASRYNDENLIAVNNKKIAEKFLKAWEGVFLDYRKQ